MDKRVSLAVAGAGKTYTICHNLNPQKRNVIIAYTNQNVKNIRNELIDSFGIVPLHTKIYTFHSFIYNFFIHPYDPLIASYFGSSYSLSKGVSINNPPEKSIPINGGYRPNPYYKKNDKLEHYCVNNRYYSSSMSDLILKVKKTREYNLFNIAIENVNYFFEYIYIDEFQDFRCNDFKLIEKIIKKCNNILLVGDYYQHSVSATNNTGIPFKNDTGIINYEQYLSLLQGMGLTIDTVTLIATRRCPERICEFISQKLNIRILHDNQHQGEVVFLDDINQIEDILNNNNITKLVWGKASSYLFNAINWSYSKGDTYNSICVILTNTFSELDNDDCDFSNQSIISVNKLYVALSRTKGHLYIIKKDKFEEIKNKYLKDINLAE